MTDITWIDSVAYNVDRDTNVEFWNRVAIGRWEPQTLKLFQQLIEPETLVLDIGAWIGPTALFAAQRAKRVIAFEPDPVAFQALRTNVAANSDADWYRRIDLRNLAVTATDEPIIIGSRSGGGDSMSSALFACNETSWTVDAVTLPELIATEADADQPIFLKIDIEGGEYDLIPAISDVLSDPRVTAMISFHPQFLQAALFEGAPKVWKRTFFAQHKAVLDSLPWHRDLRFGSKDTRSRLALSFRARLMLNFPKTMVLR